MGRPRKEDPNGNVKPDIEPKNKSYGMVFDEKTQKFQAVEVVFDCETGTMGGVKVIEANTNKDIIRERVYVLIGQSLQ